MKSEDEFAKIDFSRADVRASLARAYAAILEWQGPQQQEVVSEEGKHEGREPSGRPRTTPRSKPASKRKRKLA
jgi:hypothetical protein